MVTSLISLALNKPLPTTLAMTGEITLTGKVLPIGGVREKTVAAKRADVTDIIVPLQNKKDIDELPGMPVCSLQNINTTIIDYVKKGLNFHYANFYSDVYKVAFGESWDTTAQQLNAKSEKTQQSQPTTATITIQPNGEGGESIVLNGASSTTNEEKLEVSNNSKEEREGEGKKKNSKRRWNNDKNSSRFRHRKRKWNRKGRDEDNEIVIE
jgi:hypothetical protein